MAGRTRKQTESVVATAKTMSWSDCRCRACGKLICRAYLLPGSRIRAVCVRCGSTSVFPRSDNGQPQNKLVTIEVDN